MTKLELETSHKDGGIGQPQVTPGEFHLSNAASRMTVSAIGTPSDVARAARNAVDRHETVLRKLADRQSFELPVRYLDINAAVIAVTAAQRRAVEKGDPSLAPPYRIHECQEGLIASALTVPAARFGDYEPYPTMMDKAAVLLWSLAKSQACPNGNKRLTLVLLSTFLELNRYALECSDADMLEMLDGLGATPPSARDALIPQLASWLETVMHPLEGEEAP